MRARACAALVLLAGCAATPAPTPLRDTSAAISSQVDVQAARLSGDWYVRVGWPGAPTLVSKTPPGAGPNLAKLRLQAVPGGLTLAGTEARDIGGGKIAPEAFETRLSGGHAGRFRETGGDVFGAVELWVLWMDADDRTVAIGTPSGAFGWIMDRKAQGGQDRIGAAKEIMQWMGYDMSLVRE